MLFPIQSQRSEHTWYGTTQRISVKIQSDGDIIVQSITQNIFQALINKIFRTEWQNVYTERTKLGLDPQTFEKLGEEELVSIEVQAIDQLLYKKKLGSVKVLTLELSQELPKVINEMAVSRLISISKESQTTPTFVSSPQNAENPKTEPSEGVKSTPLPPTLPSLSKEELTQQLNRLEEQISLGKLDVVKRLIQESPFLINQVLSNGKPSLHFAIDSRQHQIASFLVDLPDTDLQLKDQSGASAFDLAMQYENLDLCKKIVAALLKNLIAPVPITPHSI